MRFKNKLIVRFFALPIPLDMIPMAVGNPITSKYFHSDSVASAKISRLSSSPSVDSLTKMDTIIKRMKRMLRELHFSRRDRFLKNINLVFC
jgi:hypothetical protein